MDPLTAFGLAASVVQFVQFGMQVASRLNEYSSTNPNDTPKSLQAIGIQLPLLLNAFDRIKAESSLNKLDFDTKCMLKGVIGGCMIQVEEIEKIIKQIRNEPGQSFGIKVRKVFASMKSEEKVWNIERNLHTYISVLILHHVVDAADAPERIPDDTSYFDVREKQVSPFFERNDLIQELDDRLHAASRLQVDTPTIIVLEGREGVGKTQLALQYCHQAKDLDQFRTIFWIDASSEESLCLGLEGMSATIRRTKEGSRQAKMDFVKKFLSELWHPWLLVLDNYQHFGWGDLLRHLPRSGYGGIIFTTRDSTSATFGEVIHVSKFLTAQQQNLLNSSLAQAVESKNLERVESLLLDGADPNSLVFNKFPCLHRAAIHGSREIVSAMLANGADPGHEALEDRPLWWAAYSGHAPVVELLLDYDDKIGYIPKLHENNLAFRTAAEKGSLETVRLIINRREVTFDGRNNNGETALTLAARAGNAELLKFLLEETACAKDKNGLDEALMILMSDSKKNRELIKFLCTTWKANPNARGRNERTPLYYTASSRDESSRKENGVEITRFFLELGADPNLVDDEGEGPLHQAALHDHTNTLKLLLEHGGDPTIQSKVGYTPLLSAMKYKSPETASILLDVDIKDSAKQKVYFEDALKYAARNGDRDTMLSIITKKTNVDINCTDWKGKTPVLLAVDGGHQSSVRLLAKHGARQDIPDENGRLPLHVAAALGFDSVVKDLVRAGKTPDMKNGLGETPLCIAATKGHEKVVEQLLRLGADRDLTNKYGDTPLELAEENKHEKVIKMLENMEIK